jgi:hypothetical protein
LLVRFPDEIFQHRLGNLKFRNYTIPQGPHSNNISRGSPDHFLSFSSDCFGFASALIDGHPGGFAYYDTLAAHADHGVGGA